MTTNIFKTALLSAVAVALTFSSCKKEEPPVTPPVVVPPVVIKDVTLTGTLKTMTLDSSKTYTISGTVVVGDGDTLIIPAGTTLLGQKSTKGTLVIKPGAMIIAEGTATHPIIFTSNQGIGEREQGDWGGIVMLGKANCNQNSPAIEGITPAVTYGTFNSNANDADNSGSLKYVRIEYAGIALTPNNETNTLTMGAVGSGTKIDYVQATYGGDDHFEWFGGTVDCKHLISYGAWDDDFDCDFGYSGRVQHAIAIRDPFNADQSGSNGFEVDNDASGTTATPKTAPVFSNVTLLGPVYDSAKAAFSGNYQHAMHLRRNCEISIFNSVIAAFPIGLNLDGTLTNYTSGLGVLENNILVSTAVKGRAARPFFVGTTASTPVADYFTKTKNNVAFNLSAPTSGTIPFSKGLADAGINPELIMGYNTVAGVSGNYPKDPNFSTFTGATQTGASFSNAKVSTWFETTTHRGAFGSNDWTNVWSNFNPQTEVY